jgi:hypothetical protein
MSMHKPVLALAVVLAFGAGTAVAETPGLGKDTLPQVKMPNRDNFHRMGSRQIGYDPIRSQAPAMR